MGIIKDLLTIMLHFTPFGFLLCAGLLFIRRKSGDKSRIMLSISFVIWGLMMLASLIYHYNDTENVRAEVFSMISLNITLFALFAMLLYPVEIVRPGSLTFKNILILFSSCLVLNFFLLLTGVEFRKFYTFGEIFPYINEYNVILRFIVTAYMLIMSFIIFYLPYKHTKSRVNLGWIRWFCAGMQVSVILYLMWIFTGSDTIRILLQTYCLIFCLIMTYQELFLRIPATIITPQQTTKTEIDNTPESRITSPLWEKLIKLLEDKSVWRNPDLTLVELASMLGTNRTTLSNIIRKEGYDGFYALINTCRIRDFIYIIEHQEINSIHETFFDVGFRSKATAIRYFRQETGTTPSEYLQKVLIKQK